MRLWKHISERLHLKRVEKVSQKTSQKSHRTEYLLNEDTPFDVTEASVI